MMRQTSKSEKPILIGQLNPESVPDSGFEGMEPGPDSDSVLDQVSEGMEPIGQMDTESRTDSEIKGMELGINDKTVAAVKSPEKIEQKDPGSVFDLDLNSDSDSVLELGINDETAAVKPLEKIEQKDSDSVLDSDPDSVLNSDSVLDADPDSVLDSDSVLELGFNDETLEVAAVKPPEKIEQDPDSDSDSNDETLEVAAVKPPEKIEQDPDSDSDSNDETLEVAAVKPPEKIQQKDPDADSDSDSNDETLEVAAVKPTEKIELKDPDSESVLEMGMEPDMNEVSILDFSANVNEIPIVLAYLDLNPTPSHAEVAPLVSTESVLNESTEGTPGYFSALEVSVPSASSASSALASSASGPNQGITNYFFILGQDNPLNQASSDSSFAVPDLISVLVAIVSTTVGLFISSGHPHPNVRISGHVLAGMASTTLFIFVLGNWFRCFPLVRLAHYLAVIDLLIMIIVLWFIITGPR